MEMSVRILCVEADPDSAAQARAALERQDGQIVVEVVTRLDEVWRRLDGVDCVVTGYDLPEADGVRLVEDIRAEYPTLPIVMFTDSGSEAVASAAISAGVTDYLRSSDGYEELAERVVEVVSADGPTAECSFTREALDALDELFYVLGPGGEIQNWNERVLEVTGYPAERLAEMNAVDLFDGDDSERIAEAVGEALRTGQATVEARLETADGDCLPYEFTGTRLTDAEGNTRGLVGIGRDVSDRRERKRERKQAETLFQHAQDALFLVDVEGGEFTIQRVNRAYEEATGFEQEEIVGESLQSAFGEAAGREIERKYRQCVEQREALTYEEELPINGEMTYWETTVAPVIVDGEVDRIVGATRDIGDRKRRMRERRENERRYRAVFADPNILVGLVDTDGTTLDVNQTAVEYIDADASAVVGEPFWETPWFAGDETTKEQLREWVERAANGEYVESELDLSEAIGEELVVSGSARPVTDESDEVTSVLVSGRDVTERKRRNRYLQQYEQVVDTVDDVVFLVNEGRDVEMANEVAREFTGVADAAIRGLSVDTLADSLTATEDGSREFEVALETAFDREEGGRSVTLELTLPLPTESRTIEYKFSPLTIDGEEMVVVVGRDITSRKQREKQLNVLDRVLRHNLRNEMNVIRGWAETISATVGDEAGSPAERIVETSDNLIATVEKERTITEILTGKPQHREVNLDSLLRRVAKTTREEHPVGRITVDCPEEVSAKATVEIDRAFGELFTNALVHSDAATPEVTVTAACDDGAVHIDIADNAPPIPEMEQDILLGTGEETPLYHGSGLGLWLVNLVVTRSGGKVLYEENEPRGNVVTVVLPRT